MIAPYKRRKINGRSIDEHRYLMECRLGRKLSRFEYRDNAYPSEVASRKPPPRS